MSSKKQYPVGGYAPGNYFCKCGTCGEQFQGDKRAFQCEPCGLKSQAEWNTLTDEEQAEQLKRNAEIANDFLKNKADEQYTTNTLSAELHEQIKKEAEAKYPFRWPLNKQGEKIEQLVGQNPVGWRKHQNVVNAYIAGATAYAPYKEKLDEALALLEESHLQLEYMQSRFGETGTGNNVLSRIKSFLDGR